MKAHVKLIFVFLFCSLNSFGQSDYVVKRISKLERPIADISKSIWIKEDGIVLQNNDNTIFFLLDIEIPPCCQNSTSSVKIYFLSYCKDSLCIENISTTEIDKGTFPVYWENSLQYFEVNDKIGFCFLIAYEHNLGGLDPQKIELWTYFENNLFKIQGIVPTHEDWNWNETYKMKDISGLENKHPDIYETVFKIWESNLNDYKSRLWNKKAHTPNNVYKSLGDE